MYLTYMMGDCYQYMSALDPAGLWDSVHHNNRQ